MLEQVLMLVLKHTKSFDLDPYLDKLNLSLIGTIGAIFYYCVFILILQIPESTIGMLCGVMSLTLCSMPFLFGKKEKLKALLFFMSSVLFSVYTTTLFSYSQSFSVFWIVILPFILYTPIIRWPVYLPYASAALVFASVIIYFPGNGSIYTANNRLIIFILVLIMSSIIIILYPEQLNRKKRITTWLIMESTGKIASCKNESDLRKYLKDFHKNLHRYNRYPSQQEEQFKEIIYSLEQLTVTLVFYIKKSMENGIIHISHEKYLHEITCGFANLKFIKNTQLPNINCNQIAHINKQLEALLLSVNSYVAIMVPENLNDR
jgi:hypothetical protein